MLFCFFLCVSSALIVLFVILCFIICVVKHIIRFVFGHRSFCDFGFYVAIVFVFCSACFESVVAFQHVFLFLALQYF